VALPLQHRLTCHVFLLFAAISIPGLIARASAQGNTESLPDAPSPQLHTNENTITILGTPRRILKDQEAIWTSPAHIRESNALGPVMLVLATALVMTTDHQVMSSSKLQNPSLNSEAATVSTGLVGGFVAGPAVIYALGEMHHDDRATETGILAGEAVADSLAVSYVLKGISRRERPAVNDAKGKFFQSGVGLDSSFPSNHAIVAWSSAAILASEYNGPMTQILAYGLATGVSVNRVVARQHFPSDVLVGSAVGWMIGRYVARKHHRTD